MDYDDGHGRKRKDYKSDILLIAFGQKISGDKIY
jgi:hypothetical protein